MKPHLPFGLIAFLSLHVSYGADIVLNVGFQTGESLNIPSVRSVSEIQAVSTIAQSGYSAPKGWVAASGSPITEIIQWTDEAIYNKPYTVTNGNSYEFILEGDSENTFSFEGNTEGIFYVKPNGSTSISVKGGDKTPHLSFIGNSVSKGSATVPPNGSVFNNYTGNLSISNIGKLTIANNATEGIGGAIYGYSGEIMLSEIDSIDFKSNTASGGGGVIGTVYGNVSFSSITGDITFSENIAQSSLAQSPPQSGSVIWSYGGKVSFNNVGGKILVASNRDDSKGSVITGAMVEFSGIKGGIEFLKNESRAINSSGSIIFREVENGITFDGHDSGTQQGGALSSSAALGTDGVIFSGITGGVSFKNNSGYTGGAISAVNAGTVTFENVRGGILFENNVCKSGPAGALRCGVLVVSNVTGDLVFNNNRTIEGSTTANYGGAAHVSNGSATIQGVQGSVVFDNNQANGTAATRGGVIWATEDISIGDVSQDIIITNNSSSGKTGSGGALFSRNKGVSLTADGRIVIQGNSATSDSGAVYAVKAVDLTAKNGDIIISGNSAGTSAGAINGMGGISLVALKGDINVSNNTAASSYGGALYSSSGTVNISAQEGKVSFAGNTAKQDGGAIYAGIVNIDAGKNGVELVNNSSLNGKGGAISISKELNMNALGGNILISGNTSANGERSAVFTRVNYSSTSVPVINLNANKAHSIIFEDSIRAGKDLTINVNAALNDGGDSGLIHFKGESGNIIGSSTEGAVLTLNIHSGTTIIEGRVEGAGNVTVGSSAILMSGYTSLVKDENGETRLSSTTGFESFNGNFVFEDGARLGTNIRNDGAEVWRINMNDVSQAIINAWGDKASDAQIFNSANLMGNVILENTYVKENDMLNVGAGALAEITGLEQGSSILATGGTVDVTKIEESDVIFGSYDSSTSKESSAQIRMDSTVGSTIKGTSLVAEKNAITVVSHDSEIVANKIVISDATLENNGTMSNVDVVEVLGGTLKGSGSFGYVNVQRGQLIVGNSPGIQTHQNLTLGSEANVIFSINGLLANNGLETGWNTQTYSNLQVSQKLSLSEGTTFTLELGKELIASLVNGEEYTFDLVFFETIEGDLSKIQLVYTEYDPNARTSKTINSPFENAQLIKNGNTLQFSGTANVSIPEPSTATLSMISLAALLCARRRQRHTGQ